VWGVLSQVGINKQQQETCIEELGYENTISNGSELSRLCVLFDPGNQFNDNSLQNNIDSNNHEGNHLSKDLSKKKKTFVILACLNTYGFTID